MVIKEQIRIGVYGMKRGFSFRNSLALICVLGVSAILRLIGIRHGLPDFLIADEKYVVLGTLKMLSLKAFIPALHYQGMSLFYYPVFYHYLSALFIIPSVVIGYATAGINNFMEYADYVSLYPTAACFAVRILSVCSGVVTVWVVYDITRRITTSRGAGLLAGALLASSLMHVVASHWARHWALTTLFVTLTALMAFRFNETPYKKYAFWGSLFAGVGFGVSYIGGCGIFFILVSLLVYFRKKEFSLAVTMWNIGPFVLVVILIIGLSYTTLFSHYGVDSSFMADKSISGALWFYSDVWDILWNVDPLILVVGVGGIVLMLKRPALALTFFIFFIGYSGVVYIAWHLEPRYVLPVIPGFAVFGGIFIDRLLARFQHRTVPFLCIFALLLCPYIIALRYDYLLLQPNTQTIAKRWIEKAIPEGSRILLNAGGNLKLIPNREAVIFKTNECPESVTFRDKIIMRWGDKQGKSKRIVRSPQYTLLDVSELKECSSALEDFKPFQYYVLAYSSGGNFLTMLSFL